MLRFVLILLPCLSACALVDNPLVDIAETPAAIPSEPTLHLVGRAGGGGTGADLVFRLVNDTDHTIGVSSYGPGSMRSERRHLVVGRPESEIHHVAEEIGADLIVVGSHGRHGLALLMGSTANGVLHGSKCDVLAVRVPESS